MPELSLRQVYVPPAVETTLPAAGVVIIHGLGADEYDLLPVVEALPGRAQYVTVRGPLAHPMGGAAWYEFDERYRPEPTSFVACFDQLRRFIAEAREAYSMDPVYLLGFSMGSAMALATFLHTPADFAGVVGLSGYLVEGCGVEFDWQAARGGQVFVGHGTQDEVVPVQLGRDAQRRLLQAEACLTYREYPMGHQISDATAQDVCRWLDDLIPT